MTRLTVAKVEHALKQTAGNVSETARALGVSRNAIYLRIKNSERLQRVLQETREELVDIAESVLRQKVQEGNMTAIIWTLKASPAAKWRGWSERHEITGAQGGPLRVEEVVLGGETEADRE